MRVCLWRAARISASFRSSKACDRRRLRRAKRKCIPPARPPVPNSESFSFASSKSRTRRARLNSLTALSPRSHKRGGARGGRAALLSHSPSSSPVAAHGSAGPPPSPASVAVVVVTREVGIARGGGQRGRPGWRSQGAASHHRASGSEGGRVGVKEGGREGTASASELFPTSRVSLARSLVHGLLNFVLSDGRRRRLRSLSPSLVLCRRLALLPPPRTSPSSERAKWAEKVCSAQLAAAVPSPSPLSVSLSARLATGSPLLCDGVRGGRAAADCMVVLVTSLAVLVFVVVVGGGGGGGGGSVSSCRRGCNGGGS